MGITSHKIVLIHECFSLAKYFKWITFHRDRGIQRTLVRFKIISYKIGLIHERVSLAEKFKCVSWFVYIEKNTIWFKYRNIHCVLAQISLIGKLGVSNYHSKYEKCFVLKLTMIYCLKIKDYCTQTMICEHFTVVCKHFFGVCGHLWVFRRSKNHLSVLIIELIG